MTQLEYNKGLTREISENNIDLSEYLDSIDLSEAVLQKGRWFDSRDASMVLEEFLADKD